MKIPSHNPRERRCAARTARGRAGFTMVELMVAIAVLLVAVLSTFSTQVTSLNLMNTSRETNTAVVELQTAMERLALLTADEIQNQFPAGQSIPVFDDRALVAERIVPTYPGAGATPGTLPIVLTLSWNDFQGRPRSLVLRSMKAR